MNETDLIKAESGTDNNTCACHKCKEMCKRSPCIGTPQDILNLINNGFKEKLKFILWGAGTIYGIPLIEMVQLKQLRNGSCIMFDSQNGSCGLHDLNLKPTEGYLATCNFQKNFESQILRGKLPSAPVIAKRWKSGTNKKTIRLIEKAMAKIT